MGHLKVSKEITDITFYSDFSNQETFYFNKSFKIPETCRTAQNLLANFPRAIVLCQVKLSGSV